MNEDEDIIVNLDAVDHDFVSFNFSVTESDFINTELIGNQLTLIPLENWNGSDQFTVTVSDDLGAEDQVLFDVIVLPINDPPIATNQTLDLIEDEVLLIYPEGNDIEDNALTFELLAQPENGIISMSGWLYLYEPNGF